MLRRRINLVLIWALIGAFCAVPAYAVDNQWICEMGDGSWHVPANWTLGRVPGSGDTVLITCSADLTVTVQAAATAAGVVNTSTLQIQSPGGLNIGAGTLDNEGTLNWLSGEIRASSLRNNSTLSIGGAGEHFFNGGGLTNNGTIIHTAGSLRIGGQVTNTGLYDFQASIAGVILGSNFNNESTGTFRKSGASTVTLSASFNNHGGAVEILEGTLIISGGGDSSGGTYSIATDGNLIYRDGTRIFRGTHGGTIDGTLRLESGTISFRSPEPVLNFSGAGFQWMGGTFNLYDGALRNDGWLVLVGTGEHFIDRGSLTNSEAATIVHTAGSLRLGGSLINRGLYDFQDSIAGVILGSNFNNESTGTFRKSGASMVTLSASFNNDTGSIEVLGGTLIVSGGGTSAGGTYSVAVDSSLIYRDGTRIFRGTHMGTIDGTLRLESGTISFRDPEPVLNFWGTGFQWMGGAFNLYDRNLRNDGLLVIMGTGDHSFAPGELTNSVDGVISHVAGSLRIGDSSGVTNRGLYDFQANVAGVILAGSFTHFNNTGRFIKSGDSSTLGTIRSSLNNTGTLEVQQGTLQIFGTVAQLAGSTLTGGTWNVNDNAMLDITSGSNITTIASGATVSLTGPNARFPKIDTLQTNAWRFILSGGRVFTTQGALTNSGAITLDVGSQLSVTTDYTQTSTGALVVMLAGVDPDHVGLLRVAGNAQLGGNLAPCMADGFTPNVGDEFLVVNYNMLSTMFDTYDGCPLDDGLALLPVYELSQLKLVVVQQ